MAYREKIEVVAGAASHEAQILACNFSNAISTFKGTSIIITDYYQHAEYRKFLRLRNQWLEETMFTSNSTMIYSNGAYKKIIGLGEKSIPWIIRDLRKSNAHWFSALSKITGTDPIQPEHSGIISKMAEDWINWAEEKGYGHP
jgi:hypothetical protein